MRTHTLVFAVASAAAAFALAPSAFAAVITVGPGKTHAKPCAAFAAASAGDTIEIDASGSYAGDVCAFNKNNLTIRGVGGRPKIDAAGKNAGGKAIWVVQGNDTVIENVELSGCTVPDKNGAGIRQEGKNLTVRNVFFHDNENGILSGANVDSTIVVEDSEFARNGAGDGYSHNMYIGEIKSFTLRGSYSHHAKVGHLVKSRALKNYILYNRLTDENGTASYEIDLPQGGASFIIGNIIQQSATSSNGGMLSFAKEGKRNPSTSLFVVNNTFVNSRSAGTFVSVAGDLGPVTLRNNIFSGTGTVCDQTSAIKDGNFVGNPMFVSASTYDYHLAAGSPAIDKGVPAGTGASEPLQPACQYVHPAHAVSRKSVGTLDQGAFEVSGETTIPCGESAPPGDAGTTPTDAGGTDAGGTDAGVTDDASTPMPGADTGTAGAEDSGASPPGATPAADEADGSCALRTTAASTTATHGAGLALLAFVVTAATRRSRRSSRNSRRSEL